MMKRMIRMITAFSMVICLLLGSSISVLADAVMEDADDSFDPYIAFGNDLTDTEKVDVMKLLDLNGEDLERYKVVDITNDEEHRYLGGYMDASVIGSRALSSVKVVKTKEGSGIGVKTKNISYCTSGMYCNALVTAGLADADVVVAGPFAISGTSALVGAMKAYAVMTGEEITEETMDAATNELVVTGELANETGDTEGIETLVAAVKEKVVSGNLSSDEDIKKAIEDSAKDLNIKLSDADKQKLIAIMNKISKLDIDVDQLKEQASQIYDKLGDLIKNNDSFFQKVGNFFSSMFDSIGKFFSNLFGK